MNNTMLEKRSFKENCMFMVVAIMAVFTLLMPSFNIVKVTMFQSYAMTGYKLIFDFEYLMRLWEMGDEMQIVSLIAAIMIGILVFVAVICCVWTIIGYLHVFDLKKYTKKMNYLCNSFMLINGVYWVIGVMYNMAYKGLVVKDYGYYNDVETSTSAWIPFVISIIFSIVLKLCVSKVPYDMTLSKIMNFSKDENNGSSMDDKKEEAILAKSVDVEELKKYKELLDCGIITQEEFDEKKKQILNTSFK